jgi:hypothetical protein
MSALRLYIYIAVAKGKRADSWCRRVSVLYLILALVPVTALPGARLKKLIRRDEAKIIHIAGVGNDEHPPECG